MGWLETILDGIPARGFGQPSHQFFTPSGDVGANHLERQRYGEPRGDRTLTWDPNIEGTQTVNVPQAQPMAPTPEPVRSYAPVNWGWEPVGSQQSLEQTFDSALDNQPSLFSPSAVSNIQTLTNPSRRYAGDRAVTRSRSPMAQAVGNVTSRTVDDTNSIF